MNPRIKKLSLGLVAARLDHSFEKNRWKEAQGKAYFANAPDQGYLKVSFFGPFYGSRNEHVSGVVLVYSGF